jgi:hypothetical protein
MKLSMHSTLISNTNKQLPKVDPSQLTLHLLSLRVHSKLLSLSLLTKFDLSLCLDRFESFFLIISFVTYFFQKRKKAEKKRVRATDEEANVVN